MKLLGTEKRMVTIEISKFDLANAIMDVVQDMLGGGIDDAGCDWVTSNCYTYIGEGKSWKVSDNPKIAMLVDAANILRYGKTL
jgi:hypothetical protein